MICNVEFKDTDKSSNILYDPIKDRIILVDTLKESEEYLEKGCVKKCMNLIHNNKIVATSNYNFNLPSIYKESIVEILQFPISKQVKLSTTSIGNYSMPGYSNHWEETGKRIDTHKNNVIITDFLKEDKKYTKLEILELITKWEENKSIPLTKFIENEI